MTQTCVILAGGLGTRLRSVVADVPKCLAPVGRKTFLDLQIACLATAGVEEVVLSLGYLAEKVIDAVTSTDHGIPVRWVVEPQLLGTGGAIEHAMGAFALDQALVANGDTHLDGDLTAMLAPLNAGSNERLRMAVVQVPDRTRFGGVDVNADGQVVGFLEKGQTGPGLINAGLYRVSRSALADHAPGSVYSLEANIMPTLAARRVMQACLIEGAFIDIGVPEDYQRFCDTHASA